MADTEFGFIEIEPEFDPSTIAEYRALGPQTGRKYGDLITKCKRHLAAVGWRFYYFKKKLKQSIKEEMRYLSPTGKRYISLAAACRGYLDEEHRSPIRPPQMGHRHLLPLLPDESSKEGSDSFGEGNIRTLKGSIPVLGGKEIIVPEENNDALGGSNFGSDSFGEGIIRTLKGSYPVLGGKRIKVPEENNNAGEKIRETPGGPNLVGKKIKMPESAEQPAKKGRDKENEGLLDDYHQPWKKIRKVEENPVPNLKNSRNPLLSALIENNVVQSGQRVSYLSKKLNGRVLATGRISLSGVVCDCCQECFTLSKFEGHAGSTNHRPSAHIFLDDGRSLAECQSGVKEMEVGSSPSELKQWEKGSTTKNHSKTVVKRTKLSTHCHKPRSKSSALDHGYLRSFRNDDLCSICYDGGDLICCDSCPASYHSGCLGFQDVPDDEFWFCPPCRCSICGEGQCSKFRLDRHEQDQIRCVQCNRVFHTDCLREKGISTCTSNLWFCTSDCEKIFSWFSQVLGKRFEFPRWIGSEKLIELRRKLAAAGKRVDLGAGELSWTLLKLNLEADVEEVNATAKKLNVALEVMHESFEPVKHPWLADGEDFIADVVYSKLSRKKRVNFKQFYTLIMEIGNEVCTVATVRVHDTRVAEVPFVATRCWYRGLGVCKDLMKVLEEKLTELGVEKLVLPAAPCMEGTWTGTTFGFTKMTDSERKDLLDYTIVDFPGTMMCQKTLTDSAVLSENDTTTSHPD